MLNLIGGPANNRQSRHQTGRQIGPYRNTLRGADPSQNVDVTNLGLLDRVSMTNPGRTNCIRSGHSR